MSCLKPVASEFVFATGTSRPADQVFLNGYSGTFSAPGISACQNFWRKIALNFSVYRLLPEISDIGPVIGSSRPKQSGRQVSTGDAHHPVSSTRGSWNGFLYRSVFTLFEVSTVDHVGIRAEFNRKEREKSLRQSGEFT
jgi:hypothetical protein